MSSSSPEKPPSHSLGLPNVRVSEHGPDALTDHRDDIFFAAIETTRMPMLVTDPRQPDNPIVFANRAFLGMTGYDINEVVGHNCRFLQGPATDRETVAAIRDAVEKRREITTEILNYKKDGSTFWNALFISPVLDPKGELVYFFASQLDVSRRRDAESALNQAQKMEALGQLTGGIAHDFNNLLQVVSGQVELIGRRRRLPDFDKELDKRVENIRTAVTKASTLTEQLLSFARKQRLEGRAVNLNTLIDSMSSLLDRTLGEHIQLETDLDAELANCRLDPTQFEVALLNVIVNARDAMPDGGTIQVTTRNELIEEADRSAFLGLSSGYYVSIAVTDHGTGIDPEIINRVMDPFFTTKEEGKGTGLGLSTVYGFAKQSGGAVDLYSELGMGTTVRLYFPVVADPSHTGDRSATGHLAETGGRETILVVDDRVEIAELAGDLLESLGYDVHLASRPAEAISRFIDDANAPPVDMLFSDIVMPGGINGFDLASRMKQRYPNIKVLLTTGFAETFHSKSYDGSYQVIKKPYRLADLARRVRQLLDTH